jgi:hypothetical protein
MSIINVEARNERARNLGALNGLRMVLVSLAPPVNPTQALLEVHFFNTNEVANILAQSATPAQARAKFPISGGHRLPAGPAVGQVQVVSVAAGPDAASLMLTVEPIGDYSTYTLSVVHSTGAGNAIDPIFSEIPFKFRPGCFNTDCAPDWDPAPPPNTDPAIDYLAKDFDSFKHVMIAAMGERVPGWRPTSEADFDMALIELMSAAADELSDYQDRVMNEAYLVSARKRVSLARHGRLMDYHIHQGNQASTWLALQLPPGAAGILPAGLTAWTGENPSWPTSQVFMTKADQAMDSRLNAMDLYTWSGAIPALAGGDTSADLQVGNGNTADVNAVRDLIRSGAITHLVIQEWRNPATGGLADADPTKRQLLELLPGNAGAESIQDPLQPAPNNWLLRVHWRDEDKLLRNYCFEVECGTTRVTGVSLFHGNLVRAFHGRPHVAPIVFREPGTLLAPINEYHFERTDHWGAICRLPDGPLAYTSTEPGGEIPPVSTLKVQVVPPGGGLETWEEEISFIHSDDSEAEGSDYLVETDELLRSVIRFGNGVNGRELPEGAEVRCTYQVGFGPDGNVGADTLTRLDAAFDPMLVGATVWNPFDVTDGRAPEPRDEIIRRVPEAYRARQLRAVTLCDYVRRAEELPEVSRAAARYAWTGSWRTVQVAIDPKGSTTLDEETRLRIEDHLNAVRLIGEDLEVRPPRFVPLEIHVALCVDDAYWPEDIRFILEQEFSDGYTPDGRLGFFHPDNWTFGQALYASQILGRIQAIQGIEHVISLTMKRFNDPSPASDAIIDVRANEILLVQNDPDHLELGFIDFDLQGGRR